MPFVSTSNVPSGYSLAYNADLLFLIRKRNEGKCLIASVCLPSNTKNPAWGGGTFHEQHVQKAFWIDANIGNVFWDSFFCRIVSHVV